MAYVENRTIHDADSHVMEFPETIGEFMSKEHLDEFKPYKRSRDEDWVIWRWVLFERKIVPGRLTILGLPAN